VADLEYKQDLGFLTDLTEELIEDQETTPDTTNNNQNLLKSFFTKKSPPTIKPIYYNPKRNSDSFKLFSDNIDILEQTPPAAITSSAIQSATATSSSIQSPTLSRPPLPNGPPPTKIISNTNVFRNALIKNFLSLFLNRRPTIEQLKNKGIIQG
jgi:hypothetical protein